MVKLLDGRTLIPFLFAWLWAGGALAAPTFLLPKHHLEPHELAVVVNDNDPLSRRIAAYYMKARGIPPQNLVHVQLPSQAANLAPERFQAIKSATDTATPAGVQAYALTWTRPYRVGCMSITTAFAVGFDRRYCAAKRCELTHNSPYYNHDSASPYTELGIRPSMVVAAADFTAAKALIDRGIASDQTQPKGQAYLVSTRDQARNVRHVIYPLVEEALGDWIGISRMETERGIRGQQDVMFYFTGVAQVPYLDSLRFRPGAMADHLTSVGGVMPQGNQMSVLRWLEAGATGSYGTVLEPCNHLQKFPNPGVAMQRYLSGETLLEAYWKSVQQPGEGVFVGEPLARPYGGHEVVESDRETLLRTRVLRAGVYELSHAPSPVGPYRPHPRPLAVPHGTSELRFPRLSAGHYRLQRLYTGPGTVRKPPAQHQIGAPMNAGERAEPHLITP